MELKILATLPGREQLVAFQGQSDFERNRVQAMGNVALVLPCFINYSNKFVCVLTF